MEQFLEEVYAVHQVHHVVHTHRGLYSDKGFWPGGLFVKEWKRVKLFGGPMKLPKDFILLFFRFSVISARFLISKWVEYLRYMGWLAVLCLLYICLSGMSSERDCSSHFTHRILLSYCCSSLQRVIDSSSSCIVVYRISCICLMSLPCRAYSVSGTDSLSHFQPIVSW